MISETVSFRKKTLISGGGIAGLTLAYWLHKYGHQPIVIEKARGIRSEGYMLDFLGTGWDVADKMGLVPQLHQIQHPVPYLIYKNDKGKTTAKLNIKALYKGLNVADKYLSLDRSDLEELLYDTIKDDVEVRFGTSVKEIQQSAQEVSVIFEDGTQEAFDLVAGADGIHSNVRELVFGDESQFARFLGYCFAVFELPNFGHDIEDGLVGYIEPNRQITVYRLENNQLLAFFIYKADNEGYIPPDKRKATLLAHYKNSGWLVPDILDSITDTTPIYLDSVTQIIMPTWSDNRVILVGDAAYCLTLISGQGASMAMGGAYILAEELSRSQDYQTAFAIYEKRLRPHVEEMQEKARKFASSFVPSSHFRIQLINLIIRLTFFSLVARFVGKQFNVASIFREDEF